ncbi:perlucin-like protein [Saccostrea cucullata]|uniref:perlucin-like protein n=1 Tax=Saccostrea cuccullata TaxID=36930 RepID=UPI002ECFE631
MVLSSIFFFASVDARYVINGNCLVIFCNILIKFPQILQQLKPPHDCPASWIRNEDSSYCFVKKGLQWSSSKESCISMGAHLLAIETELEKTWIQDKASGDSWWIGGTDLNSEGTFYWEHSSKNMTYTNWYSNQPDNDTIGINENCVSMVRSGYWHDYPCNHTFYYICEK